MSGPYPFLSPEWIDAARAARAGFTPTDVGFSLAMNLVVNDVPFGEDRLDAHVVAEGGVVDIELGHVPTPDVSVTLDYSTAKAVLVDGDGEAAMAAFMAGKIRVEGDMTKLLQFQSRPVTDDERALQATLRSMTAS